MTHLVPIHCSTILCKTQVIRWRARWHSPSNVNRWRECANQRQLSWSDSWQLREAVKKNLKSKAKKELLREPSFNNLWLGRKGYPSKKRLRLEPKYVMLVLYWRGTWENNGFIKVFDCPALCMGLSNFYSRTHSSSSRVLVAPPLQKIITASFLPMATDYQVLSACSPHLSYKKNNNLIPNLTNFAWVFTNINIIIIKIV